MAAMNAYGISQGLGKVQEATDDLAETDRRVETGKAYVLVGNDYYEITAIEHMVQRDEVTVVCPIIVTGRKI